MRVIKVFGPGCLKCETLYENVVKALEELKIEAQIEYIKDLKQMALYGVFKTPALWVDGSLLSQGKVLSVDEIKQILTT